MRFASNNNQMRKKIQDYSYGLTDLIGKGYSSSVFRGMNQKTRQQVAIKVIDLKTIKDKPARHMLQGQIDALKKLNHINIMKCHDIYSTVNNCYIITEFCNEGDLENLLKKRQKLPEEEAIPIFRDIVNGFKVIAQAGFLHRDLKPANILLKDKIAKIADFGFAKRATSNPKQTVNVGSPLYMSPQALKNNIYTIKNDIWSMGIILYQMLHGRAPWESSTEKQLIQKINKQIYTLNRNLSQDLKDFIRKCLINDQSKRMGITQFNNHPFILRITEEGGIPQLLRKQTSCNANEPPTRDFNTNKEIPSNQLLENITTEPTSLHHRKNPQVKPKTQKQFTAQINYMRFIYRFLELFPTPEDSGSPTLGLRFIATKQMISLLQSLTQSLQLQNPFNFEGWDQFIACEQKKTYYKQVLSDYGSRYQKNKKQLQELISTVKNDRRLYCICDTNFTRTQHLSLLGIRFSIQECKQLWAELCKQEQKHSQSEYQVIFGKGALRLDFAMTFYQLNCLLIDNFHDPDYFARNSKIDVIIQNKPITLVPSMKSELEHKLKMLQIIK